MNIGIDASFLRKPGTGIGQVTLGILQALIEKNGAPGRSVASSHTFFLYCEELPRVSFELPKNFLFRPFLPLWKRDDIPRKWLWEQLLCRHARKDRCEAFLSLAQSSTIMPKNIPHTMIVHDIIPHFFPHYLFSLSRKLSYHAVKKGIRRADHLIAVSQTTARDVARALSLGEDAITVLYPACNPIFNAAMSSQALGATLARYGLRSGYIYHGGGLEIRKNTERLLVAYANLRKKYPAAPPLVISGTVYPKKNILATDVESILSRLRLKDHVSLLGFVPDEDVPALYQGSLIFVYPSLYEGFGLPVLEAFASGVPVIAGNAGALPEVTRDAALVVDPSDASDIEAGMERLLNDESLRLSLIQKGERRAADFSFSKMAAEALRILEDNSSQR